jgi:hypothetical protein
MRKVFCIGLMCVLGYTLPAVSAEKMTPYEIKQVRNTPMVMNEAEHPRMHVVFEHTKHNGISCFTCHHKPVAGVNVLASCSAEGCHIDTDRKSRAAGSYFQAIHRVDNDHSCVGCHTKEEKNHSRRLAGCTTCHDAEQLQTVNR